MPALSLSAWAAKQPPCPPPVPWYLILAALPSHPAGCGLGLQGEEGLKEGPGLGDLGSHVGIGVLAKGLRGVHARQQANVVLVGSQVAVLGDVVHVQHRESEETGPTS